ncbi:MAG: TetR family transcriptional regulator [Gemmatimonadales bacterium]|jgi:AcrR family transcriptional regulator|nr:TetR family transcriptional regulator [Gemmatimonadales bacterium]
MPVAAPPPAAAERTADAILDAAEPLFARLGYARTTIKAIGAAARLNPALLYYYFDDKDGLYRAVLRRRIRQLAAHGGALLADAPTPHDAIRRFAAAYMDFMLRHPTLPRLVAREMIDHDAAHAVAEVRTTVAAMFERLADVIRAGQASGAFRRGVDPARTALSLVSPLIWALVARPAAGILLTGGRRELSDAALRTFAAHTAELTLAALAPRPER